jgi:adenylate cyclase
MKRTKLIRLKNAMLLANGISNVIGVSIVLFLNSTAAQRPAEIRELALLIDFIFIPLAFLIVFAVTVFYERPIRLYLKMSFQGETASEALTFLARRRLLNEPVFLIAIDLAIWLSAGVIYSLFFWAADASRFMIISAFLIDLFTGLITITVAFFVFEHVLQKRLAPFFFPNGGLYMTPKTVHIRIRTRLAAFLFACNIIPFLGVLSLVRDSVHMDGNPIAALENLRGDIITNALIFMAVGIWLTILVSRNLTHPLQEIIRVLRRVRHGDFDNQVRVTSNDEIDYTGDVINKMNEGLKERDFIMETFGKYVAQEVRDEVLSGRIPMDGEMKDVTILFADLRDFTPLTESHDPKLVVKIMNGYFEEMADAIQKENGLVLQYLGDEIYAVFGAPIHRPGHPTHAVRAAVTMNQKLARLNEDFSRQGLPTLRHGIGIHTGTAVAANIGSRDRLSYLLVGDTVNLASRLQGLTKTLKQDVILSKATRTRLEAGFSLKSLSAATVRGRSEPVEIFALA